MQRFLSIHHSICPTCRSTIAQFDGDRCPSCRRRLRLRVRVQDDRWAAFVVGLVGLSAGLGFNLMFMLLIVAMTWYSHDQAATVFLTIGVVIFSALLVLWLACRRLIRRQRPLVRRLLATAAALTPLIDLIVFVLMTQT